MPASSSNRGALGRLVAAGAVAAASSGGAVYGVGASELHATARALEAQPRVELAAAPSLSGAAQTVLLIGSDHRASAAKRDARSDTIMLVRLSPRAQAVTVLSVPRDL